ncbi:MAG: restriction endonuclease subunit S, partial [Lachnospiraceae bacterium]|nr:restriction endonuclease subunit S [Lachnospiraceae bacterium]
TCWHAFMRFNGNSGARSDRFAITDKIFNEMPISMPQDVDEQKKIGAFLTEVESLITLHQRKCDKYRELKRGLLQQMFV